MIITLQQRKLLMLRMATLIVVVKLVLSFQETNLKLMVPHLQHQVKAHVYFVEILVFTLPKRQLEDSSDKLVMLLQLELLLEKMVVLVVSAMLNFQLQLKLLKL